MVIQLQSTKTSRSYWPLLRIFLNSKKTPLISPLFQNNHFISDFFKQKAKLFNIFYQIFFDNNSNLLKNFNQVTDRPLPFITNSAGDIGNIIQNLNSMKSHDHENISAWMLKICNDTTNKPDKFIFKQALNTEFF